MISPYVSYTAGFVFTSFVLLIILPFFRPSLSEQSPIKFLKLIMYGKTPTEMVSEIFSNHLKRADSSSELHASLKVELYINMGTLIIELCDWAAKMRVFAFILASSKDEAFILNYAIFVVCLCSAMFLTIKNRYRMAVDIKIDMDEGCRISRFPACGFLSSLDVEVRAYRLARENFSHRQSLFLMAIQECWALPLTLWFMSTKTSCDVADNDDSSMFSNYEFLTCFASVCICFQLIGYKCSFIPVLISNNASMDNCIKMAKLRKQPDSRSVQHRGQRTVNMGTLEGTAVSGRHPTYGRQPRGSAPAASNGGKVLPDKPTPNDKEALTDALAFFQREVLTDGNSNNSDTDNINNTQRRDSLSGRDD